MARAEVIVKVRDLPEVKEAIAVLVAEVEALRVERAGLHAHLADYHDLVSRVAWSLALRRRARRAYLTLRWRSAREFNRLSYSLLGAKP